MKFGDCIDWAKEVDRVLTEEKEIFYKFQPNNTFIIALKKCAPRGRLLDCGCGMGRWCEFFTEAGYEYVGVDQSEYAIKKAREHHSNLNFVQMFLWDMNFHEEFDVAVSIAVLQHNLMEEKLRILPRINEALKKNGVFLMTESTVQKETATQLTNAGWITLASRFGFSLLENWGERKHYYLFKKAKLV